MESIQRNKMTVPEFFGKLFSFRDQIHLTHLRQPDKKLSTHLALNDLYDELLGLIDEIIETYQGVYGIQNIEIPMSKSGVPIDIVNSLYSMIQGNRSLFIESWIQNQLDELATITAKTLYKLKFVQ